MQGTSPGCCGKILLDSESGDPSAGLFIEAERQKMGRRECWRSFSIAQSRKIISRKILCSSISSKAVLESNYTGQTAMEVCNHNQLVCA